MTHDQHFTEERPRLLAVAYNMLGQVADAEDVVQDAYLRWHSLRDTTVDKPPAMLTTIVTRLAIDRLRRAKREREQYIGPWLPDPVVDGSDLSEQMVNNEQVTYALLATMERLAPVERAVFLLRDVFDYDYADIAEIVEKSPDNCRQIAARARQHVGAARVRTRPTKREAHALQRAFARAVRSGDLSRMTRLLADDAILFSDGGPSVTAARKPIFGALNIAKLWVGLVRKADQSVGVRFCTVAGDPAYRLDYVDRPQSVVVLEISDRQITGIRMVLNPDKLALLGPPPPLRPIARVAIRLAQRFSRPG
jgi:RNA polymerase sigma-70 factor (ECF subfamily)